VAAQAKLLTKKSLAMTCGLAGYFRIGPKLPFSGRICRWIPQIACSPDFRITAISVITLMTLQSGLP
jgi:hypothetical protein